MLLNLIHGNYTSALAVASCCFPLLGCTLAVIILHFVYFKWQ